MADEGTRKEQPIEPGEGTGDDHVFSSGDRVGTGLGAAGGGAAGAAVGAALGGPAGAVVGAGVGMLAGGIAAHVAAKDFDPIAEEHFWRAAYGTRPYHQMSQRYEDWHDAYRYGWESARKHHGQPFEKLSPRLEQDWAARRGNCTLEWCDASPAVKDAFDRVSASHGKPTEIPRASE